MKLSYLLLAALLLTTSVFADKSELSKRIVKRYVEKREIKGKIKVSLSMAIT